MTILNVNNPPKQPEFNLGPLVNYEQTDTESTSQTSTYERSRLADIRSRVTSFITTKRSVSSAVVRSSKQPSLSKRVSSGNLKRTNSVLSSISSSKYWAYKASKNHRTLFFFTPSNRIRKLMVTITESTIFDAIVIILIFMNCISLALTNPNNSPTMLYILSVVEWIFNILFTIELVMKIIALGFILHPGSYLRSPWNLLDFLIVITSYLQILPGVSSYSAARSLRALRPLRTVNGVPGLRIIVNALLQSIPPFINVLILLTFSFFMFGIFGVQMFRGVLKNRCVVSDSLKIVDGVQTWTYALDNNAEEIICSRFFMGRSCPPTFDGKSVHCQEYAGPNPYDGTMNFDNIFWGFMQIFQIYAGEEWTTIMYYYQDGWSHLAVLYFIFVMFFGGFFALNLGLAVINDKFSQVNASTKKNELPLRKRILRRLKKRKVTAWLVRKLSWIDYRSSDSESIGSTDLSSEFSDANSEDPTSGSKKNYIQSLKQQGKIASATSVDSYDLGFHSQEFSDDGFYNDAKQRPIQRKDSLATHFKKLRRLRRRRKESSKPKHWCFTIPTHCYRIFKKIRKFVNRVVRNAWFGRAILLIIIINTCIMAIEHHNQPQWISRFTEIANYVFIGIFTIELILKLFGLGISFFYDGFNALDIIVVISSYLEIIFSDFSSFSALRSLRLLRVFKLLSWGSLRVLATTLLNSMSSIFYLSIIFGLFLFTMSLIGMLTFTGKLDSNEAPVQNFNDFIHSFVTVFQITSKENWIDVYQNLVAAASGDVFQTVVIVLFMVSTIILGDFIILNLFLSILIQSFEDNTKVKFEARSLNKRNQLQSFITEDLSNVMNETNGTVVNVDEPTENEKFNLRSIMTRAWKRLRSRRNVYAGHTIPSIPEELDKEERLKSLHSSSNGLDSDSTSTSMSSQGAFMREREAMPLRGNSLFLFSSKNKLRIFMRKVMIHRITTSFFILCTVVSAILPAIMDPYSDSSSTLGQIIFWVTVVNTAIFIVEMLLKIFVQGLFVYNWKARKRTGYLNDYWNILDLFIIISDIIFLCLFFTNYRGIRAIAALSCLRFFSRVQSLKVVVNTLMRALPAIVNVLIVCCLLFLVFGILGVQLFKGALYYCSTSRISTEQDCLFYEGVNRTMDFIWNPYSSTCSMQDSFASTIITRSDCLPPMVWINHSWNFDNIANSLLILFEVASIEEWPNISNLAVSSVGIDMQPKPGYNIAAAFFFIAFVIIGAVFIINMFVGVVLSNFNRIKEEEDGALMLTEEQREWVSTQRLFMKLKLIRRTFPPTNRIRNLIYNIVTDIRFEFLISSIIVINVIFMAIEYDQMPELLSTILTIANLVFTTIFLLEAILKIIGLGPFQYFRDYWNLFDFVVVAISIAGVIINFVDTGISLNATVLRVFRVFRILRLVRLVKTTKQIRTLLETLYYSIPSMMNVLLTVALTCYIYAIIGMNLFYAMKLDSDIHHLAHFRGILPSLLLIIRISTSEDWNSIMRSLMNTDDCVGSECGNPWLAIPFFVSFIVVCTYVIMNLFIAVILDNFESQMKFEESALNSSDLAKFTEIWSDLDPKATYMIKTGLLKNLLQRVGPPLGLPPDCSRAELIRKLVSLDIPEHQGKIHFIETLIPLARRVYNVELPEKERKKVERNLFKKFKSLKKMSGTLGYTTGEYFAATYIQAAYKGRQVRRSGAAIIGLELARTESGRLKFKIDRKCHRVAKIRELEKKEAGELSSESDDEIVEYHTVDNYEPPPEDHFSNSKRASEDSSNALFANQSFFNRPRNTNLNSVQSIDSIE